MASIAAGRSASGRTGMMKVTLGNTARTLTEAAARVTSGGAPMAPGGGGDRLPGLAAGDAGPARAPRGAARRRARALPRRLDRRLPAVVRAGLLRLLPGDAQR